MPTVQKAYDASSITVLTGLQPVRKRPGMYIGDTSSLQGLHHMAYEIVDNSVDEALAGYATEVILTLHADGSVTVSDDGRGMPVDEHPVEKKSAAEVIMTVLHAGGKFDQNSYEVSGGLHGVGASVVNALSMSLKLTIFRDGYEHFMEFTRGDTVAPLKRVGKCAKEKTGTVVTFKPDPEIFAVLDFDREILSTRLRDIAFLNSGIKLTLIDERGAETYREDYHAENGIAGMIRYLDRARQPLIPEPLHIRAKKDGIQVEIALEWTDDFNEHQYAFTNNIPQKDHGTHVAGFRAAMSRVIANYIEQEAIKKGAQVEPDDLREGLTAVVSIKMPDPKFSSQTKEKLVSSEAQSAVQAVAAEGLSTWLEEHPAEAKLIIDKAAAAASARVASRRARDLSRQTKGQQVASLPGKLADCQSKKPEECELFLVEGDSAGGSAKQGRDRKNQAILPLRGKILNVERARKDQILSSQEIGTLITALGTGIHDQFTPDKCRYHKIVIMTDADVDGAHIRTLLLTFFFRQMRELIERGYLWIAQPPLYKLTSGRKERFLGDEASLNSEIARIGCDGLELGSLGNDELAQHVLELRACLKPIKLLAERFGSESLADALTTAGVFHAAFNGGDMAGACARAESIINRPLDPETDGSWKLSITSDQGLSASFTQEGVVEERLLSAGDLGRGQESLAIARAQAKIDVLMNAIRASGDILGPLSLWAEIEKRGSKGIEIQRFKGLGEMNPDQLWGTTLDPTARRLVRVDIPRAEKADELFSILMGEASEEKKQYIVSNGLNAALDF